MRDRDKTKAQLVRELETLRRRISELETVETAWQDTEKRLWNRTRALHERVKELKCLYGMSNLFELKSKSLAEVLQGTADLIRHAWQYPEIACARITLDGDQFATANFRETKWETSREYHCERRTSRLCGGVLPGRATQMQWRGFSLKRKEVFFWR